MTNHLGQIKAALQSRSPIYIRVKAVPKSPKTEIAEQMEDGTYKIRIAAPATDGKANAELVKFLKKSLKAKEVVIVGGRKDRIKLIRIN